jgi:hypothetical protein
MRLRAALVGAGLAGFLVSPAPAAAESALGPVARHRHRLHSTGSPRGRHRREGLQSGGRPDDGDDEGKLEAADRVPDRGVGAARLSQTRHDDLERRHRVLRTKPPSPAWSGGSRRSSKRRDSPQSPTGPREDLRTAGRAPVNRPLSLPRTAQEAYVRHLRHSGRLALPGVPGEAAPRPSGCVPRPVPGQRWREIRIARDPEIRAAREASRARTVARSASDSLWGT